MRLAAAVAVALTLLMVYVVSSYAEDPTPPVPAAPSSVAPAPAPPPKLADADAFQIEKLTLERQVLEERFGRLKAEGERLQAQIPQVQREWTDKGREIDAAIAEAAKKSGLDPKQGWRPDPVAKMWRK